MLYSRWICLSFRLNNFIQDAMDWADSHLHQFQVIESLSKKKKFMGIPVEDDFGDGWMHSIEFEGQCEKEPKKKYPVIAKSLIECQ